MTIESLFLFPVMLGILYASAIYGVTFFGKYQMQDAVDRAVAAALHVDRSAYAAGDVPAAVKERAEAALTNFKGSLPDSWSGSLVSNCLTELAGEVEVIFCSLTYPDFSTNPIAPSLNFGFLGEFPPLPNELHAEARAAF